MKRDKDYDRKKKNDVKCPQCGKLMKQGSLRRHLTAKHPADSQNTRQSDQVCLPCMGVKKKMAVYSQHQ